MKVPPLIVSSLLTLVSFLCWNSPTFQCLHRNRFVPLDHLPLKKDFLKALLRIHFLIKYWFSIFRAIQWLLSSQLCRPNRKKLLDKVQSSLNGAPNDDDVSVNFKISTAGKKILDNAASGKSKKRAGGGVLELK